MSASLKTESDFLILIHILNLHFVPGIHFKIKEDFLCQFA
jgi:hypothetical protein